MVAPCLNPFDVTRESFDWELDLGSAELQRRYDELPDLDRWYVTNPLRFERSPNVWFFLQREDAPDPVPSVADLCSRFREHRFERLSAVQRNLVLGDDDRYRPSPRTVTLPAGAPPEPCGPILEHVDGRRTMGEILDSAGVEPRIAAVNAIRVRLTTSQFPFLTPVG